MWHREGNGPDNLPTITSLPPPLTESQGGGWEPNKKKIIRGALVLEKTSSKREIIFDRGGGGGIIERGVNLPKGNGVSILREVNEILEEGGLRR